MLEITIILSAICVALAVILSVVLRSQKNEKEYLRNAVFESWVRETKSQCRKWALYYKKEEPIIEVEDTNGIKQISIYKLHPLTSERIFLASININFDRYMRGVSVGWSDVMKDHPLERWPISGVSWCPKNLILRSELWKLFNDKLQSFEVVKETLVESAHA